MAGTVAGRNVGALDRQIRIFVGIALVLMWIFGPLGVWGLLGFYPLVTGLTGVCPLYPLLGISTARAAPAVSPAPDGPAPPPAGG